MPMSCSLATNASSNVFGNAFNVLVSHMDWIGMIASS
jgi:hypothetical protein